jgi:hypothetical protein
MVATRDMRTRSLWRTNSRRLTLLLLVIAVTPAATLVWLGVQLRRSGPWWRNAIWSFARWPCKARFDRWSSRSPTFSASLSTKRHTVHTNRPLHLLSPAQWGIVVAHCGEWRHPTLVGELAKNPVRTFEVTRDGRRVIFSSDKRATVDIWALENVLPAQPPAAMR